MTRGKVSTPAANWVSKCTHVVRSLLSSHLAHQGSLTLLSFLSLAGSGGDAGAEGRSHNLLRMLLPASRADRDVFLAVALVRTTAVPVCQHHVAHPECLHG